MGWPLGADYDRMAEVHGLEVGSVHQSWTHGLFVTSALQHAVMAVACGMADVVACITAISFTREQSNLGGPDDPEGMREQGATHGENPVYGLTSPPSGRLSRCNGTWRSMAPHQPNWRRCRWPCASTPFSAPTR